MARLRGGGVTFFRLILVSSFMTPFRWVVSVLLTGALLLLLWGVVIEPRLVLDVRHYDTEVPRLSQAWEDHTIALVSDLQVGMWLGNTGMVRKTVRRVIDQDPSLVLIAGDFVYHPDSSRVEEAVSLVRPVTEAGLPVVAVLGNHDYAMSSDSDEANEETARYLEQELEAIGVQVLENESTAIAAPGTDSSLYLVGLGSSWAEKSSPSAAFANVPPDAARVVLMHNPVGYRHLPPQTSALTLAAHTHGGQIRVPYTPSESWLEIARSREVIADGWAADSIGADGNRLYVTRGTGMSILPLRIFCPPELTFFTLRRARGTVSDPEPGTEPK